MTDIELEQVKELARRLMCTVDAESLNEINTALSELEAYPEFYLRVHKAE